MSATRAAIAGTPRTMTSAIQSECVQVDFDPTVVSYAQLVDLMFALHDPAGNPGYAQYASLVLTRDDEQLRIARERARIVSERLGRPLTTRIEPLKRFWPAEDYHQKYYLRNDAALMEVVRGMVGGDELAFRDSTAAMRLNGYASGSGTQARLAGEIESFGLSADARAHLVSIVGDTASGAACALP